MLRNSPIFHLDGTVNPIGKLRDCQGLCSESAHLGRPINWTQGTVESGAPQAVVNQRLIDVANEHHLTNVQQQPTHERKALAIFMTNNPALVKNGSVVLGVSDHEGMVIVDMDVCPIYNKPKPRSIFQLTKANWDRIMEESEEFCNHFLSTYETQSID